MLRKTNLFAFIAVLVAMILFVSPVLACSISPPTVIVGECITGGRNVEFKGGFSGVGSGWRGEVIIGTTVIWTADFNNGHPNPTFDFFATAPAGSYTGKVVLEEKDGKDWYEYSHKDISFSVSPCATPTNTPSPTATEDKRIHICHRDQGNPEWKEIEIATSARPAHLNHQWGADIYPVPEGGCPLPPTATPTNTATFTDTPTDTPTDIPTEIPTDTPTNTPTDTPTDTPVPPSATPTSTATPTPTDTQVPPTETFTPTNTEIPPTATFTPTYTQVPPTPTGTYVPPSPTPTEIPPSCKPYDTGLVLYQLHMHKTDWIHYGYFLFNGDKEGICQIVTNGPFPNVQFVQQYCNCKLPLDFMWHTDTYDVLHVWKTCDGRIFYKNGDGQIVAPFGTFVFGQYCSSAECPIR